MTKNTSPIVFEHISALLETATQHSVLLIERAIVGLFRLASLIIDKVRIAIDVAAAIDLKIPSSLPCATNYTSLWTLSEGSRHLLLSQLRSKSCLVLCP